MKVPLLDLQAQYETIRAELTPVINRIFASQQFVLGAEGESLEREIAGYCQTQAAIGCASGSDALLLALMSIGVTAGDEVITSAFSFFATASAITRLGARPVFVDIDPRTYNMDPALVEAAITNQTKAIVPVHIYGQCADMDPLLELSRQSGVPIVEDAAQAIGAEDRGRRAGSMGAIGCFSFYPSKNLGGAGDGGIMTTNDMDHARRLYMLRVHGEQDKYHHKLVGLNSRLDELQAAVLRVKLQHLEQWTQARQRKARQYELMFPDAGLKDLIEPPYIRTNARHVFHQYVIRVRQAKRDPLLDHLRRSDIGSGVYYPVPLHMQGCFGYLGYRRGDLPETESAAAETLALPVYSELMDEQQNYVVSTIAEFFKS